MNQGKNFRYIQFDTDHGRGYACVCFDWQRDTNTIKYKAGISFCSPKDSFSKHIARLKAENRYNGSTRVKNVNKHVESAVSVPEPKTKFVSNDEFKTIFADIVSKCDEKEAVPQWVRTAIESGAWSLGLTQEQGSLSEPCKS